jgi:hypothetical protein
VKASSRTGIVGEPIDLIGFDAFVPLYSFDNSGHQLPSCKVGSILERHRAAFG